jgi:hypothetical protein
MRLAEIKALSVVQALAHHQIQQLSLHQLVPEHHFIKFADLTALSVVQIS